MAIVQLSPAAIFCLRSSAPIIFPLSIFWILCILGQELDLVSHSWLIFVAPWVVAFFVALGRNYFASRAIVKHAAEQGAIIPPSVQENRVSVSRRLMDCFETGCPADAFDKWNEKYGYTYSFASLSDKGIVTTEPEHIKAILATQNHEFPKGTEFFAVTQSFMGTGIFNSDGDIWKFHRAMARPLFNKDRVSDLDIFERHANNAIIQIEKRLREGYPVDLQDAAARFTIDTTTEHIFGKAVGSTSARFPYPPGSRQDSSLPTDKHPSDRFLTASIQAQKQLQLRILMGKYWPLREVWTDKLIPLRKAVNDFYEPVLVDALNRKNRNMTVAPDAEKGGKELVSLLERLVQSTDDKASIQDGLVGLLVAGRDTTTSLITFALYMISEHPRMVSRLRSEILEKVGTRRPTNEDICDMKFLRAFLNETLRLYPPIHANFRTAGVATTLPNKGGAPYYIPEGTRVSFFPFLSHRRTDLWGPDALEFDPERFLDDRLGKYLTPNPSIFLPFSTGPRVCLGQQFAYNEASYFLIRLLQTYSSFTLALDAQPAKSVTPKSSLSTSPGYMEKDKITFTPFTATLGVKGGLWLRMDGEAK
ncbi:cytochrome P450 monooxygenase pc-3 [Desarmillaria ectypa]|nr:cytochrome P450 monooxygenase pc-3 [Desarmillaria ectypa]